MVTEMLWSWENKTGLHGDEASSNREVFQVLLDDFWEELGILFLRYVNTRDADPQLLEGIATLLQVSPAVLQEMCPVSPQWCDRRFRLLIHLFRRDRTFSNPYILPFIYR